MDKRRVVVGGVIKRKTRETQCGFDPRGRLGVYEQRAKAKAQVDDVKPRVSAS